MTTSRQFTEDPIEDLQKQLNDLRRAFREVANRKDVVVPIWDAATIPDTFPDGVAGLFVVGDDNIPYIWKDGAWVALSAPGVSSMDVIFPFSTPGVQIVQNGNMPAVAEAALTIDHIRATVGTAPTGSGLTVRVNKNGSSIGTVTIAVSTNTNTFTPSSTTMAIGDILKYDVTAIGSTIPGSDLSIEVWGSYD